MIGTLTINALLIDVDYGPHWNRLSINGTCIGQIVGADTGGATLVRCFLGSSDSSDFYVRLNADGDSLASVKYEPELLTDRELRDLILVRANVHTATGAALDQIADFFGLSRTKAL